MQVLADKNNSKQAKRMQRYEKKLASKKHKCAGGRLAHQHNVAMSVGHEFSIRAGVNNLLEGNPACGRPNGKRPQRNSPV